MSATFGLPLRVRRSIRRRVVTVQFFFTMVVIGACNVAALWLVGRAFWWAVRP